MSPPACQLIDYVALLYDGLNKQEFGFPVNLHVFKKWNSIAKYSPKGALEKMLHAWTMIKVADKIKPDLYYITW